MTPDTGPSALHSTLEAPRVREIHAAELPATGLFGRLFLLLCFLLSPAVAAAQSDQLEILWGNRQTNPKQRDRKTGEPVVTSTGCFEYEETDLSVAGRGLALSFKRKHRSGTLVPSTLGPGWDLNWNKYIVLPLQFTPLEPPYGGPDKMPEDSEPVTELAQYVPGIPPSHLPPHFHYGYYKMQEGAFYYDGETRIDLFRYRSPDPWITPSGYFSRLRSIGDRIVYLPLADGGTQPSYRAPDSFEMRNSEGTVFVFGLVEKAWDTVAFRYYLTTLRDRHGNEVHLDYDILGVTQRPRLARIYDTLGRRYDLAYGTSGRLTSITDYSGRQVVYGYDTLGRLTTVRSPLYSSGPGQLLPAGRYLRYQYSGTGALLTSLWSGNELADDGTPIGPPYLVNTYDGLGRIVRQLHGGSKVVGNQAIEAGGTFLFRYRTPSSATNHGWFSEKSSTITIDPNGNVRFDAFTSEGYNVVSIEMTGRVDPLSVTDSTTLDQIVDVVLGPTSDNVSGSIRSAAMTEPPMRASDPTGFVTTRVFNSDARLLRESAPGRLTVNTYSDARDDVFQRGNLIRTEEWPVPDDGSEPRAKVYIYEPVYNQVRAIIDPRGNSPSFVPPNGGTASPSRYMLLNTFDYQEGDLAAPGNPVTTLATTWGIAVRQNYFFQQVAGWWSALPVQGMMNSSGLGDVNGDGRTDQIPGNIVRIQKPTAHGFVAGGASFQAQPDSGSTVRYNDFSLPVLTTSSAGEWIAYEYNSVQVPDGVTITPVATLQHPPRTLTPGSATGSSGGGLRRLVRFPDPAPTGSTVRYSYDALGRKTQELDDRGAATKFFHDPLDQLVKITSPLGYAVVHYLDKNGNLVRRERANVRPLFDAQGHPAGLQEGEMHVTELHYDLLDAPVLVGTRLTRTSWAWSRIRYDRNGKKVLTMSPESDVQSGNVEAVIYDERGLVFKHSRGGVPPGFSTLQANANITEAPFTAASTSIVTSHYDLGGLEVLTIDELGRSKTTRYDSFGLESRSDSPLPGHYTTTEHDIAGNTTRTRRFGAGNGQASTMLQESRYLFDERNRVVEQNELLLGIDGVAASPDGPLTPGDGYVTTRFEYDAGDRAVTVIDDNGDRALTEYDRMGRRVRAVDAVGNVMEWAYGRSGKVVRQVSIEKDGVTGAMNPYPTWFFRDIQDRIVATVDWSGRTTRYAYDSQDNLVFESDAEGGPGAALPSLDLHGDFAGPLALPSLPTNDHGNTKTYEHDLAGRLTRVDTWMRLGGTGAGPIDVTQCGDGKLTKQLQYDRNSRLVQTRDDNGNATRFEYDDHDRRWRTTEPDGSSDTITSFAANGRVETRVDNNGSSFSHGYDDLDRRLSISVQPASGSTGTTRQTFTYNGLGFVTSSTDDNDPSLASDDVLVTTMYDSLGRELREDISAEGGIKSVLSSFDGLGRRTELRYPDGRKLQYDHDAIGRPWRIREGATVHARRTFAGRHDPANLALRNDQVTTYYAYDAGRNMTSQATLSGAATLVQNDYGHSRLGRRRYEVRIHDGGRGSVWSYDSAYRLLDDARDVNDPVSEAALPGSGGPIGARTAYQLDGVQNMTAMTIDGTAHTNPPNGLNQYTTFLGEARQFDLSGNRTATGSRQYAFDAFNRLRSMSESGTTVARFSYTADGRRVTLTAGSRTTRFVYDGALCIEEWSVNRGAIARQYLFDEWLGAPIALRTFGTGADDYLLLEDGRGSLVAAVNSGGAIQERVKYTAYGMPQFLDAFSAPLASNVSSIGNTRLYNGYLFDAASKLYSCGARYYDPAESRFVSRDPIGGWKDPAAQGNAYAYAGCDPVNRADDSGLWPVWVHEKATSDLVTRKLKKHMGDDPHAKYLGKVAGKAASDFDSKPGSQEPGNSHWHYMRNGLNGESKDTAIWKAEAEIDSKLDDAADKLLDPGSDRWDRFNNVEDAMKDFGEAAHIMEDESSPFHTDSRGDPRPWEGMNKNPVDGAVHGVSEALTDPGFLPSAAASACWDRLNRAVGDAIMDLTGSKYENCGLSSDEIEGAYRDAAASEDAAGKLANADTKEDIEKVVTDVEAKAKESMKAAIKEKYKDNPEEAERFLKKLENAECKGDCDHHGSVSRRRNQHNTTTFRKCKKGAFQLSDPTNP